MAGAHNLSIILNGRPTTMSHEQLAILLKNTPASRVEKVEVMYSTPPQYHIRGAAINLLLKVYRPEESGLQGEVNADIYTITEMAHKEESAYFTPLLNGI